MMGFYLRGCMSVTGVVASAVRWTRRHPRWARVLAFVLIDALIVLGGNTYAYAADGNAPLAPFLPGGGIHDSSGIPLSSYTILPLDRGDMFSWQKSLISSLVDPIWAGHLGAVGWMIWFLNWILTFEWVDWISTPVNDTATILESILGQLNWIPFALTIAAAAGGIAMLAGRKATGAVELLISAICAVLAVGLLANPVAALTASGGALDAAQKYGGEVAVLVVSDKGQSWNPNSDDILSEAVTTQLVDLFIRSPAETVAFGHALTGACKTAFTKAMKSSSPAVTGDSTVRDRVSECDPDAKNYVENPNFGSVFTVLIVSSGGITLFIFAMFLALILMISVAFFLIAAIKVMVNIYLGILPINRYPLWSSLADVATGLVSIVVMTVIVALYLKVLVSILWSTSELGVVNQMMFINLIVLILLILLWRVRAAAQKGGRTMAEQLAKLGLNGGGANPAAPSNALANMTRLLNTASNLLSKGGSTPSRGPNVAAAVANTPTVPTTLQVPDMVATPSPRRVPSRASIGRPAPAQGALPAGQSALPAKAGKTADVVVTAVNVAKAAPGGPGAMVGQAALSIGSGIVQRGAMKALSGPAATDSLETHTPSWRRRIAVGSDGIGHIERAVPRPSTEIELFKPRMPARSPRNRDVRELLGNVTS